MRAQVYEGVLHVHNVWTAPIEATAIIALLLYLTNGTYGLPALGIVFFVLPMQCERRSAAAPSASMLRSRATREAPHSLDWVTRWPHVPAWRCFAGPLGFRLP